ncbi:MAG: 1-acyl-sn-glycerol-3-phosphate acyltransferase [Acidobacteriota bacterium]|nr:MAG: 1-acyl-sn-glycerol-3-phosphate acyltransferase [Acidobacteriota bacterium]
MWLYYHTRLMVPVGAVMWRLRAHGLERMPRRGPFVIACNHASFMDPWFLCGTVLHVPIRYVVSARWFGRSRFWHAFFRDCGCIPTNPRRPGEAIGQIVEHLDQGDVVGLFPEGRITHTGKMNPIRHGIGWIAALSGVPVVPCALRGNYEALPRHRLVPRPHRVSLHVGEPLVFSGGRMSDPDPEAVHQFVVGLASEICRLADQEDRISRVAPRQPPRELPKSLDSDNSDIPADETAPVEVEQGPSELTGSG